MTDEPQDAEGHAAAWGVTKQQVDAGALQSSLTDLAALVTGPRGLSELLGQIATYAANVIPGAGGVGVTLLRVDRPVNRVEAVAASDPFVTQIDEIQYVTVNEGCAWHRPRESGRAPAPLRVPVSRRLEARSPCVQSVRSVVDAAAVAHVDGDDGGSRRRMSRITR